MPSHKLQKRQLNRQKNLKKNLKDDLLKWICEKHATNSPLDRQLLKKKALQISQTLDLTNFKCSEQWITTFLKNHGFSASLTTCAGPHFRDYRLWIDVMRTVLTQYKYKDLFHVDELTMYSDIFPLKAESNSNIQDSEEINATNLISILLCCNSSGTDKLPPLISGPFKPDINREDCKYYYNENSCISDEIFGDWISSLNDTMLQNNRKILLLLHRHRIRALGNTQLSNVKLIFFPADFPPHLRPLRRDIFLFAKMKYRSIYAEKILQFGSKWSLEEMVNAVLKSWHEVSRELIVSSFQRTTFRSDDKLLEIGNDDWEKLNTGINFKKLITFDDYLSDAPNSVSNEAKHVIRERHNYNLRTASHEVLQVDEVNEISKMKNQLLEEAQLKSENLSAAQEVSEDDNLVINLDLNQANEQDTNRDLDRGENFDDNLEESQVICEDDQMKGNEIIEIDNPEMREEDQAISTENKMMNKENQTIRECQTVSKGNQTEENFENNVSNNFEFNLEENALDLSDKVSNCCPGSSGEFQVVKNKTIEFVVDEVINSDLETDATQDIMLINSFERNSDQIDQQQEREASRNTNEDCNQSLNLEKRSNVASLDDGNEPPKKIPKGNDWIDSYRNVYFFGSNSPALSGSSSQNVDNSNDLKNCVSNDSQTEIKSNKTPGPGLLFTKRGTLNPRSSKD